MFGGSKTNRNPAIFEPEFFSIQGLRGQQEIIGRTGGVFGGSRITNFSLITAQRILHNVRKDRGVQQLRD